VRVALSNEHDAGKLTGPNLGSGGEPLMLDVVRLFR
jgi:hypothetical protein